MLIYIVYTGNKVYNHIYKARIVNDVARKATINQEEILQKKNQILQRTTSRPC